MVRHPDGDAPVTFLGPITGFGAKAGKRSYGFLLMQCGDNEPLKLEYPDKQPAIQAMNALLQNDWTFRVPNTKLLYGIEKGLKSAFKKGAEAGKREVVAA